MNLGLEGKAAIVCASTRGLGRACAEALLAEGVHVVINGRDVRRTEHTAGELLEQWPGQVIGIAGDVTEPEGRKALLAALIALHVIAQRGVCIAEPLRPLVFLAGVRP